MQDRECPCSCCQEPQIGCLCSHYPEDEQCDCLYCVDMVSHAV